MKKISTIIYLCLLSASISKAQLPSIDSLKIIPTNPTVNDTVKVISYTSLGFNPCFLTSSFLNIINDTIDVFARHMAFVIPNPCTSIDTSTIGQLSPGTYELHYHLIDTFSAPTFDIDTIVFTVQPASGLQLIDNSDQRIKIYPNPFTDIIKIKTIGNEQFEVSLHDVTSRKIFNQSFTTSTTINTAKLAKGIYLYEVRNKNGVIKKGKVVKD